MPVIRWNIGWHGRVWTRGDLRAMGDHPGEVPDEPAQDLMGDTERLTLIARLVEHVGVNRVIDLRRGG